MHNNTDPTSDGKMTTKGIQDKYMNKETKEKRKKTQLVYKNCNSKSSITDITYRNYKLTNEISTRQVIPSITLD